MKCILTLSYNPLKTIRHQRMLHKHCIMRITRRLASGNFGGSISTEQFHLIAFYLLSSYLPFLLMKDLTPLSCALKCMTHTSWLQINRVVALTPGLFSKHFCQHQRDRVKISLDFPTHYMAASSKMLR